jgi:hypothetical protein
MVKEKSSFICSDYRELRMIMAYIALYALIFRYFRTFSSIIKLSNRNSQQAKSKVHMKVVDLSDRTAKERGRNNFPK